MPDLRALPPRIVLSISVIAGALLAPAAPVFHATEAETGKSLVCRLLPGSERVALVFTHSMYGGEVREEYGAGKDGRIVRVEMTTANAAAAEYYAYDGAVSQAGDRFRVDVPPASFDEIVVRVDRVGAQWLVWDGGGFDLQAAAGEGVPVRLTLDRPSLLDRLFTEDC